MHGSRCGCWCCWLVGVAMSLGARVCKEMHTQIFVKIEKGEPVESIHLSSESNTYTPIPEYMRQVDFKSNEDIPIDENFAGYIAEAKNERYPSSDFMNAWQDSDCVYYANPSIELENYKNFYCRLQFDVKSQAGETISFSCTVEIPYVKSWEYLFVEKTLEVPQYGKVQLLFGYNLWVTI